MRFKRFKALKIHGYIDISMNFNEDLSILIGGNGSGKTTALKLIQALIAPSFKELILVNFEEISLIFLENDIEQEIKCIKNKDTITLSSSELDTKLDIDSIDYNEIEYFKNSKKENMFFEKIDSLPLEHRKHPVIEYISNLSSPIFLGLERKNEKERYDERFDYREKVYYSESFDRNIKNRRLYEGNLSSGLNDAQVLISDFYRNIRSYDEYSISKMKEELLLSSFKYQTINVKEYNESLTNWKKKSDLLNKKDEVLEVLAKIERNKNVLTSELERFFTKLSTLMKDNKQDVETSGIDLELIVNMAQIDKIFELVSIVQAHKERTDKMYLKVNNFLEIINGFYKDSNKQIEISPIGKLMVKRPDGRKSNIHTLSSGERQLLVIFAHAIFNSHQKTERIFIIDEPEVSLHLRWQQIFISTIIENCPRTQFVMATHSPDIVDEYDDYIVKSWRK